MRLADLTPNLISKMASLEDQRRYAELAGIVIHQDDVTAPPGKVGKGTHPLEKKEQGQFANWTLERYPARIWHSTHRSSTATPGTPDFVVPVNGYTLYIEFKRPGFKLSPDQEAYRANLEKEKIHLHVVYSAQQAMDLVKFYAGLH